MPHGMTNREWRQLTAQEQIEIELKEDAQLTQTRINFDDHMRYDKLSSRELEWLRDRILELERTAGINQ